MKTTRTASGIVGTLALASIVALAGSVGAETATDNLEISATVSANCTIDAGSVDFGAYDPVSANASSPLDATGTISVTCTSGAAATITLGQGDNADSGSSDAAPLRRMSDGASDFLSYALFSDSGYTTTWGNDASVDVDVTGTGSAENLTVYGRVAAGQNVPAGTFTDTVVATVTF